MVPGIASVGSSTTYQINSANGSPVSISLLATFDGTLADVANELRLGLIDNEGIANALSQKLKTAKDAVRPDRESILHAFIQQVEAQTGKHITAYASAIL